MNNNAAPNDNTRRTNEVEPDNSLLTPREEQSTPSAIPSPEGTHKKAEDGEDPTPDETDGNSGKPFLQPFPWLNIKVRSTHTINKHYGEKHMTMTP